MTTEGSK